MDDNLDAFTAYRRVEADIDLDAARYNIEKVIEKNPVSSLVCLVIKADAYGHGAVEYAREFNDLANYFAVATMDEAVELRNAGIELPILILGYTDKCDYKRAIDYRIRIAMYNLQEAEELSEIAIKNGKKALVHIKVDSGMSRIGLQCNEAGVEEAYKIYNLEGLDAEGIFTHYAKADYFDKSDAARQYEAFSWFTSQLKERGADIRLKHIDNSAGAMEIHSNGFDMMRLGIVIYGLYPSEEIDKSIDLKPVMSLKSHVIHVKTLEAGRGVGYGWSYVTTKPTRVATVSVGYADGYPRALSNKGRVLIHGKYAPIIGRVCMDQIMVDVTDIETETFEVKVGDQVVLFGSQGQNIISVEEVAEPANSFNYEAVCNISRRVPRVYYKDGEICNVVNYLV
ncbi:MAG: alanine racemase [Eubacterium sp.]|nr:alanine racemase [Eubacterium sp.]